MNYLRLEADPYKTDAVVRIVIRQIGLGTGQVVVVRHG